MKVMKFGGSSVAKADRIEKVKDIVLQTMQNDEILVIVVSALGGVTDTLLDTAALAVKGDETYKEHFDELNYRHRSTAEKLFEGEGIKSFLPYLKEKNRNLENLYNGISLIKELSPRILDIVASYGELLSSYLIAGYMKQYIPDLIHVDSRKIIKTDSSFGGAQVDFDVTNENIKKHFNKPGVYVMGGFISSNEENVTTTLGRGGSDYTAAILAAGLEASEVEIWTDVDGVMTSDPRKVKKAFSLSEMTYEEAMEMSHFGAKVIHPPTVQPALDKLIPIRIRNTFNPSFPGTLISKTSQDDLTVKGVSSINEIALISVQGSGLIGVTGIAGRLFSTLARHKVNIILITQASSEHSISFAVLPKQADLAKKAIEEEFIYERRANLIDELKIEGNLAIVAVIGSNMKNTIGVSGKTFKALAQNGVNIRAIAQGSSELNISSVIGKEDISKALNALHDAFFLAGSKTINLFMVGVGLIGSTLMKQVTEQYDYLKERLSLDVRFVAISNSKKMLFNSDGIDVVEWEKELETGEKANLERFIEEMKSMNLPNSIFIDSTASAAPIKHYESILESSISITTPNKIANSSSFADYQNFQYLAAKHGVQFLYETNVGAGLPVIKTLKDLLQSGDEVIKIEAVLSGSLSYIFNSFSGDKRFSDIVKDAKKKGFTEPDPRDDLSGKDVARKVLILSREMGRTIEMDDIEVENILPEACVKAKTVEEFLSALEANDDHFTKMQKAAAKDGKLLRFLASIGEEKTTVSLKAVDNSNPFASLSGSDNMIVFTTARYKERPLVVKGPGAGAEVTAAGVFSEIISIGNGVSN